MQVTLPEMGESVTEGTIAKWLKQPGDQVREGEGLVEVTTDKVDAEVPAPASGTLVKILAEAGKTVAVGSALTEIAVGADGDATAKKDPPPPAAAKPAAVETTQPVQPAAPNGGQVAAAVEGTEGAELLAKAKGIDLATIKGSGPGGSIRRRDVAEAIERNPPPLPSPAEAPALPSPKGGGKIAEVPTVPSPPSAG